MKKKEISILITSKNTESNYWKDIFKYSDLFYILSWRDIKVRYKQTVIGIAWSVLRPLITMIIFTVVFSKIANLPSDGNTPYPVLVFIALLPWHFFSTSVSESGNSFIANERLISKVYFPRIIIPVSSIFTSLVDFSISLLLLLLLMLYYNYIPSWHLVFLPFFILLLLILSIGIGVLLSSLNVEFRDFRYIIPFILQLGLYISPVGFSSSVIPDKWNIVYSFNPLVGIIDGFRWCFIADARELNIFTLMISVFVSFFFLFIGLSYFRKTEKRFADII